MNNKHFCQGPTCHEQPTTSRLQKSTGLLRTRYAQMPLDHDTDWNNLFKYFCSQGCYNDFANTYVREVIAIAPRTEALETPINVTKEQRQYGWRDGTYTETVINRVDNNGG